MPVGLDAKGAVVVQNGLPRLGVWLMPDNSRPGSLEDFLAQLILPGDVLWPKAERCVASIEPDARLFTNEAKAVIHTWLAWQERPGMPPGMAIKAKHLRAESPASTDCISWVRRLFEFT